MKDKPATLADIFGAAIQNLGDAIIQSVDDALLASRGESTLDVPDLDTEAETWAKTQGIALIHGRQMARAADQPNLARAYDDETGAATDTNACVDFARTIERVPAFALAPVDEAQLSACACWLGERGMPWVTRGTGLSTGGQTLIAGACVVRLDRLGGITVDGDTVTVGAGTTFAEIETALEPVSRRLPVMPSFRAASVGGTLASGTGIGDTSHCHGHLARHVRRLRVLTVDGEVHDVEPGDERFAAALGGFGQTGVITSATLATIERCAVVTGARAYWESLGDFVDDAISIAEDEPAYEYLTATRHWLGEYPVVGDVAVFQRHTALDMSALDDLNARFEEVTQANVGDIAHARWRRLPRDMCRPSLEALLPYPGGIEAMRAIDAVLETAKLVSALPRGATIAVVALDQMPASMVPATEGRYAIYLGLRPMIRQHRLRAALRGLDAARAAVIEHGGRVLASSTLPLSGPLDLGTWIGPERVAALRAMRARSGSALLNPGLID